MFGQAATMSDFHIALYAMLTSAVPLFLFFGFRHSTSRFIRFRLRKEARAARSLDRLGDLLAFSICSHLRDTERRDRAHVRDGDCPCDRSAAIYRSLAVLLCLSALFGALSGLAGNILSVMRDDRSFTIRKAAHSSYRPFHHFSRSGYRPAFPSFRSETGHGPSASAGSPAFRFRCLEENILKAMWKKESMLWIDESEENPSDRPIVLHAILWRLKQGADGSSKKRAIYSYSADGRQKAASIVRLHRLWELYLASELGVSNRENSFERRRDGAHFDSRYRREADPALANPKVDPHNNPFPKGRFYEPLLGLRIF